jgi:hypothetical protein
MKSPGEIWRQRLWLWVPALVFFLANATAYTVYRFGFADRVKSLQEDLKDQQQKLDPLVVRQQKLDTLLARSERNEREIRRLYGEKLATRKERLTAITAEVWGLARKAGLSPKSFSYPEQEIQQYGLTKRSFIFSVEGTYVNLRQLINFLELSDSFLSLEAVTLGPGSASRQVKAPRAGVVRTPLPPPPEGSELHMSLTLSTLFASDPNESTPPKSPPAPRTSQTAPPPAERKAEF